MSQSQNNTIEVCSCNGQKPHLHISGVAVPIQADHSEGSSSRVLEVSENINTSKVSEDINTSKVPEDVSYAVGTIGWLSKELEPWMKNNPHAFIYIRVREVENGVVKSTYNRVTPSFVRGSMWYASERNLYNVDNIAQRSNPAHHINTLQIGIMYPEDSKDIPHLNHTCNNLREMYGQDVLHSVRANHTPEELLTKLVESYPMMPKQQQLVLSKNNEFNIHYYYFPQEDKWFTRPQLGKKIFFLFLTETAN